jgi:hypothetical protein
MAPPVGLAVQVVDTSVKCQVFGPACNVKAGADVANHPIAAKAAAKNRIFRIPALPPLLDYET